MKLIPAILLICLGFWYLKKGPDKTKGPENTSLSKLQTSQFSAQIQPILQRKCSPCHFPGGKLYEKLPFDKGETIISHKAGVLKRFGKDEEERKMILQFIDQNSGSK